MEILSSDRAKEFGDLTIRGITREFILDTEHSGPGKDPMGREVLSFDDRTQLNRKNFNLSWNLALETGGFLVGDIIKIELTWEAMKQSDREERTS